MSDSDAINFVFDNKELALSSDTWDAFCDKVKAAGKPDFYRNYKWLPPYFYTLKAHPELKWISRALALPEVTNLSQLFESFSYDASGSAGGYYISCELQAHRGGRLKFDQERNVATHYGAKWYVLRGHGLSEEAKRRIEPALISGSVRSFECIRRDDGVLVVARSASIGGAWVCLLPKDYDFKQHLSPSDREFVERDEEDERKLHLKGAA